MCGVCDTRCVLAKPHEGRVRADLVPCDQDDTGAHSCQRVTAATSPIPEVAPVITTVLPFMSARILVRVIVLRLIDPNRDRPHPYRLGWEWSHQVSRVRLVAQPARVVTRCVDERHAIVNLGNQLIGVRRDDREGAHPFAGSRVLPILHNPPMPNGLPSFMAMA